MSIMTRAKKRNTAIALTLGAMLALTGCAASDPDAVAPGDDNGNTTEIPVLERNDDLRDRLPQEILDRGSIVSVNSGSFPPYTIVGTDGNYSGASSDLLVALSQLWDIEVKQETVDGFSSVLTGISAGRYDFAFGPNGDFKERQENADFVDYVQEFVVFAVAAGNPENITDLDSTCGKKISVMAAGSAERVIKEQSEKCVADGNEPVEVMSFKDQPQSILAVQSGRADGFFSSQAPLTYFVEEADGDLELAATGQSNGFDTLYQGAIVGKGSDLGLVLQDSLQELFDNGTYDAIMEKWNLSGNTIDAPGMNLAVS